jgi:hypothetical protein
VREPDPHERDDEEHPVAVERRAAVQVPERDQSRTPVVRGRGSRAVATCPTGQPRRRHRARSTRPRRRSCQPRLRPRAQAGR